MTRETRLLVATITVSTIVVLLLSTLRFPETTRIAEVPPAPIERLAVSAAYEQLARSVERVARRITPDVFAIRSTSTAAPRPRTLDDLLNTPLTDQSKRYFPALRVATDRAVLTGDAGFSTSTVTAQDGRSFRVMGVDALRRLMVLHVPDAPSSAVGSVTLSELQTPTYVVVAEGTAAGIAFRPVFVGSADRFTDPRWTRPLLAVSGTPLTNPGALVFSLEGQFLGVALVQPSGTFAIAGAAEVIAAAAELREGTVSGLESFGLTVQPLDQSLARALGVSEGVVIASVEDAGPAGDQLEPADVVVAVDGTAVSTPDDLLVRLARAEPDEPIQFSIVRGGQTGSITVIPHVSPGSAEAADDDRMVLERGTDGSVVQELGVDTALARSGVRAGDIIARAGSIAAPTPAQVSAAVRQLPENGLVIVVRRGNNDYVLTVDPRAR